MAKKKITRKELLKGPDEFMTLSGRAAAYLSGHVRELKIIGIAIAVIVACYFGGYAYVRHINNKGQDAYNTAYDTLTADPSKGETPEDRKRAEVLFEEIISDYGWSKAARLALPQLGHIKFTENQYDDAIRFYDRFADEVAGETAYEDLNSLALAACYEAKGDLKKAISILNGLVDVPTNPFRETAMLSLERLYRIDQQLEKANDILRKFVEDYPASPFLSMAKARL